MVNIEDFVLDRKQKIYAIICDQDMQRGSAKSCFLKISKVQHKNKKIKNVHGGKDLLSKAHDGGSTANIPNLLEFIIFKGFRLEEVSTIAEENSNSITTPLEVLIGVIIFYPGANLHSSTRPNMPPPSGVSHLLFHRRFH
ncbi:hypothetical protein ACP275_05G088800 [Erythranthe tilingii]